MAYYIYYMTARVKARLCSYTCVCVCVTLYYSFIRLGRLFHVTCIIGIEANDAIHIIYVHWILFNNDNDAI